jgi:hypothetical protein
MILSDIRLLVGIHLGDKGLSPSIIAPALNILTFLDEELTLSGFQVSNTIEKEVERLKNAIILRNYDPTQEDEDDISSDLDIEDVLSDRDSDDDDDTVLKIEDDDDDDE